VPFTAIDLEDPRALWAWMEEQRKAGNEVLAVSHNANLSNGVMFPTEVDDRGRPIDRAWAETPGGAQQRAALRELRGRGRGPLSEAAFSAPRMRRGSRRRCRR